MNYLSFVIWLLSWPECENSSLAKLVWPGQRSETGPLPLTRPPR